MKRILRLVVGIVCIVIGIFIFVSFFKSQKTQSGETYATIIRVDSEIETDSDGMETRHYYPIIEYTINDSRYENRLPDSGSTNSAEYKEGDRVEIKYNPDNPNEISKKGSVGGIIAGAFFSIVGLIVSVSVFIV